MTDLQNADMSTYVDPKFQDPQAAPTQDFYRHTNGGWLDTHQIPADRPADGAFQQLFDRSEADQRQLVESLEADAADPDAAKMATIYQQFLDEDAVEASGYAPLQSLMDSIYGATDHGQLFAVMGQLMREGVGGLFDASVTVDMNDTSRYAIFFSQAGLELPDEAFYREEQYEPIRQAYVAFLDEAATMVSDELADVMGPQSSGEFGATVLQVETLIASHHWDNVSCRDAVKSNNPMRLQDFQAAHPHLDWERWWQGLGQQPAPDTWVSVRQPSFFTAMDQQWSQVPLAQWQAWMAAHVLSHFAPFLPGALLQSQFNFRRTLTGAEQLRPRWKRALGFVESTMGDALGRLFVEAHFPPSHREQMDSLVARLLEAYRQSITALEWMGPDTRERALVKLGTFNPKIGYPSKWRDYSDFTPGENLVETARHNAAFATDFDFAHLQWDQVDRDEWFMTPQTVNAYYYPLLNEIVFPAAILRPPFFDPQAPDAVNFGAIGAVIGHEIGHGFDDQGSQYDENGLLRNWWEDSDREEFTARTKRLITQYAQFSPAQLSDEHKVNGELTIGENIGDLGGLSIAWKAYLLSLEERGIASPDEDVHGDYTGAQLFFYSWARVWRQKSRDELMIQLLAIDPHSPTEFRCNGVVKNMDAFHETFGTQPGDGMWMDPKERVTIW